MWKKSYYVMCHNFGPSLTIIMNDGNQYFEKINFMSKKLHGVTCQIIING